MFLEGDEVVGKDTEGARKVDTVMTLFAGKKSPNDLEAERLNVWNA